MATKHLFRSEKNRICAGICGGLGEYFNIDPALLRLVWILTVIFTGVIPGLVAYFIAILVIPLAPHHLEHEHVHTDN
ncbi:MAG: PspC domain-containing protein [Patescibacteria group bacterium]